MSFRRHALLLTAVPALLGLLAAPAGAATTARGTAASTSVPLHVEAVNLPVDVGRLSLTATTDGDVVAGAPWAAVGLTLLDVGGATFGQVQVASDGTSTSEGAAVDRDTAIGAVGAQVGNLLALADDTAGSATAAVTTLTTEAAVLNALDLTATVTDVVANVDDSAARATHTLTLAGVDLDLAHVLGTVLSTLPLEDLLALAEQFDVTVPFDVDAVGNVVVATEDLLVAVAEAATAAAGVESAAGDLLAADGGTFAELQGLLAEVDAVALLVNPVDQINALTALLADGRMPAACAALVLDLDLLSIAGDITTVSDCVQAAIDAHLASLAAALTTLEDAVQDYADAVAGAVAAAGVLDGRSSDLADAIGLVQDLLDALLAADLFALSPLEITQQVTAIGGDLDGSSASHVCQVTTITALGQDPVEVTDCDGGGLLGPIVQTVTDTLALALDTVGGVDAGDGVTLELFGTKEDAVTETADGFVRATSVMEVLALTVPDITVRPCGAAQQVCALGVDLDGTLATALGTVDGVLATAQTTASDALTSVADLLTALGSTADVAAQAGAQSIIDDAIAVVQGVVSGIELGDLGTGGGLTVNGARIVVDPELEAEHQVVAAPTAGSPDPSTDPDPAPAPDPSDPTLPNTGGGAALAAVLALGAGAWLVSRRRED